MASVISKGFFARSKFIFPINKRYNSNMAKLVETERLGPIYMIGINRPEKRNCVNQATAEELVKTFAEFESDDTLSVAVLHGKGGNFCAGYDLSELSSAEKSDFKLPQFTDFTEGRGPMGPSRRMFSKPVIASVTGHAVAGGLELALMCDMRVAEESAIFGVFCRRFGVPLIDGGTVRLPRLIGLSRAMDMILTGRPVSGKEALEMGLANRLAPTGAGLGVAVQLAHRLSLFPQQCLLQDRQSAYNAMYDAASFQEAIDHELNTGMEIIAKESVQGASRFVSGVGKSGSFEEFEPDSKL